MVGTAYGIGVAGELQLPHIRLVAELDSAAARPENDFTGETERSRHIRVRVLAKLPLLEMQLKRFRGGLALSAGVGAEFVDFARRKSVKRDFISWGLDSFNGVATKRLGGSLVNFDLGYRFDIARAPAEKKRVRPPGCTGPCDVTTVTDPIDLSLSFLLTIRWGPLK